MDKKAADKLISRQYHSFVSIRVLAPVIFPLKGDAILIHRERSAIGNSYTMCVTGKIRQYGCWPCKGSFGIDHSLDLRQPCQYEMTRQSEGRGGFLT